VLASTTEGANIGYQILAADEELAGTWSVYTEPVPLAADQRLIAIAHRIGYKPSSMIELVGSTL